MNDTLKNIVSYFNIFLSVISIIGLIYLPIYGCWYIYNSYQIKHDGIDAVATVIRKNSNGYLDYLDYDVYYNDQYYMGSVYVVGKRIWRDIIIGDHLPARIMPNKMHLQRLYIKTGITPQYIRVKLTPYPLNIQDLERERRRIDSMYYRQPRKRK